MLKWKEPIKIGYLPTKRSFLSMQEAVRQKEMAIQVIRKIRPEMIQIVTLDEICENGIAYKEKEVSEIVNRFEAAGIDALFIQFCDFGEESVVANIAAELKVPVAVWGARDERASTFEERGRDSQCGMFAATKVLQRLNVTYSYLYSEPADSDTFREGFLNFVRVVSVMKHLKGLRIAKIGERPQPFMSVMSNEATLLSKFGITSVPVSPVVIANRMEEIMKKKGEAYQTYLLDLKTRFDYSNTQESAVEKIAAIKLAIQEIVTELHCSAAAIECWPTCTDLFKVPVCAVVGELTNDGLPVSCETDINGAVTMAILSAAMLGEEPAFLADLTIRNPENDQSELLWHCGPFAYSLKNPSEKAALVNGQESFELKTGDITVCRFDEINNQYYLFAGEGKSTTGPKTTGTYVWFEVDDWKKWEQKLMYGPYIHHLGGVYGKLFPVLREVARYLDIHFDTVDQEGPVCLS